VLYGSDMMRSLVGYARRLVLAGVMDACVVPKRIPKWQRRFVNECDG
jgi:hypothetical protein